ncbi:MRAS2 [Anopheles darlingi]|uniref:MRAS2 n=1 Tax=Anopheles darlingi TaxID=43151 RepID=W5JKE0_ANODA|nr:MRAS2 [Anopheles darlingi]
MKGRHLRRRFSLQPSFMKDDSTEERPRRENEKLQNMFTVVKLLLKYPGLVAKDAVWLNNDENSINSNVRHKIVMMGAAKVGKSSLITQFLYSSFSPKYKRTVEEMHHGHFSVGGVNLTLDILDTSGSYEQQQQLHLIEKWSRCPVSFAVIRPAASSGTNRARSVDGDGQTRILRPKSTDRFPAMRALSISSADAFILVYDVTDSGTFEEVKAIREQIHEIKSTTAVPIVVVGNKTDLSEEDEDLRQVARDTTESLVTVDWENGFVEASAKLNRNVTQIFKELLVQAKITYNLSPALRRRRRQSLPQQASTGSSGAPATPQASPSVHVPSVAQLQHLQQIQDKSLGGKRNSCILS